MRLVATTVLVCFGLFEGTEHFLHYLSGYLTYGETYWEVWAVNALHYAGIPCCAILAYNNIKAARYVLFGLLIWWGYSHFIQLTWPINQPGFFGQEGFAGWKKAVDIISVGVMYLLILFGSAVVVSRKT